MEKLLRALDRHCLESRMFFVGQVEIGGKMDARGDPVSVGVPDPLQCPAYVYLVRDVQANAFGHVRWRVAINDQIILAEAAGDGRAEVPARTGDQNDQFLLLVQD